MFGGMNSLWQAVRKECGKWTWTQNGISYTGAYPSTNCNFANSNLIAYGYYTQLDGSIVRVTTALTDSVKVGLWRIISDSTAATSSAAANTAATTAAATTAAATTCTSSSHECCWVKRTWQLMGKTTSVSSTNATACCYVLGSTTQISGIPGVRCTSTGIVTEIRWYYQSLQGQIPPELSNLVNLAKLGLEFNKLNGSIPTELGNLVKLQGLYLFGNQLTGSIPLSLGNLVNLEFIYLNINQLNGSIPTELGNLTKLTRLYLYYNQLSGPIPTSLGQLVKLEQIYLSDNPRLNGTFTPQCLTTSGAIPKVNIDNTGVIICGCVAASTPPTIFPPAGTPDACLATGPALTLSKRILAFSQVIGSFKYTCNTDSYNNPYADCLNSMAKICNTTDSWTLEKKANCHTGVNMMFGNMSIHWQRVRKQCGQWPFTLNGITYPADTSDNCNSANSNLIANAIYILKDGVQVRVTSGLTESIKVQLWSNTLLA